MQRLSSKTLLTPLVALLIAGLTLTGCASLSNTEKGAGAGAGAGAVLGGIIGRTQDNTAKGAIIGAVAGGAAGAVIGRQMDKQAEELDEDLEGAEVAKIEDPETGETAGIQVTFDNAILFDIDSSTLRSGAQQDLSNLARSLEKYPGTDALVVGHTDATGSDEYNLGLSQRRAESAASELMRDGVARDRITTLGKGEQEPVASNDTDYGRQQNRRVEIAIYASEEYQNEVARQSEGS